MDRHQYHEAKRLAHDLRVGDDQDASMVLSHVLRERDALIVMREAQRMAGPQAVESIRLDQRTGLVALVDNYCQTGHLVGRLMPQNQYYPQYPNQWNNGQYYNNPNQFYNPNQYSWNNGQYYNNPNQFYNPNQYAWNNQQYYNNPNQFYNPNQYAWNNQQQYYNPNQYYRQPTYYSGQNYRPYYPQNGVDIALSFMLGRRH